MSCYTVSSFCLQLRKEILIMRVEKVDKQRISLWISTTQNDRLERDSVKYGVTKSDIIRVAIMDYFRKVDTLDLPFLDYEK